MGNDFAGETIAFETSGVELRYEKVLSTSLLQFHASTSLRHPGDLPDALPPHDGICFVQKLVRSRKLLQD